MNCRYCGKEVLAVWNLLYEGHLALETPDLSRTWTRYHCTSGNSPRGIHGIWDKDRDTAVMQGRRVDMAWARI